MSATRFIFSGHAVGFAAQFNRLDKSADLNEVVPALGVSALPATGGLAEASVKDYSFDVERPRKRRLVSVQSMRTSASGRKSGNCYETEISCDVENLTVLEKLRVGRLKMHFLSSRDAAGEESEPVVSTLGSSIEGLRLGGVDATIVLDDEPLRYCGTRDQLAAFYRAQTPAYRRAQSWRFGADPDAPDIAERRNCCKWSLVREIRLSGAETARQDISVDGYTIVWRGFGRIILGEMLVKGQERRLTMMRLAMGSDAAGDGSVGDGQSNGQLGT